jgi:hypothetical protein
MTSHPDTHMSEEEVKARIDEREESFNDFCKLPTDVFESTDSARRIWDHVVEQHNARMNTLKEEQAPHIHQFVIPVDYKYIGRGYFGDGSNAHFTGIGVTRLRCACGDEEDRDVLV